MAGLVVGLVFGLGCGRAHATTLTCPAGPMWTRERQQRPPIGEPAPVVGVVVIERFGGDLGWLAIPPRRRGVWIIPAPGDGIVYIIDCLYAEGPSSRLIVPGPAVLRVPRWRWM